MKRLSVALFLQIAPQVASFLVFAIVVRRYDVREVALFVYTLNLYYLLLPALNPAYEQIVQVRLKDGSHTVGTVLSSSALVILAISVLLSIATVAYLWLSASDPEALRIFWGFLPALILTPSTVIFQLFRLRGDYSSLTWVTASSILVAVTVRALLVLAQADIVWLALAFGIDPLMTAMHSILRSYRQTHTTPFSVPRASLVKELVQLTPMLVGHALLGVLFLRGPTLILAQTSSAADLVKYGIALQFLAAMLSVSNSLFFVVGPSLAHLEIGSAEFMRLSRALFLLCSGLCVFFIISNLVLTEVIAVHIFGPKAVGAGLVAAALSPIGPMQLLMNYRNMLALRTREFPYQLFALLVSFAFMATMMWLLIPGYAGLGAAISLSLAHFVCGYPAALLVPAMRPLFRNLVRCGLGLAGWHDALGFARRYAHR
jgi:O-antigen/teichoic acid export membrane protein